jgi:hypothetical protein
VLTGILLSVVVWLYRLRVCTAVFLCWEERSGIQRGILKRPKGEEAKLSSVEVWERKFLAGVDLVVGDQLCDLNGQGVASRK